jgi:hypothetical protein
LILVSGPKLLVLRAIPNQIQITGLRA